MLFGSGLPSFVSGLPALPPLRKARDAKEETKMLCFPIEACNRIIFTGSAASRAAT
jgi:hypothetical protein